MEAGGFVPRRNVERILRDTLVLVPPNNTRCLDLVVTGLGIHRGVPLFYDVTCVAPVTAIGLRRTGCLTIDRGAVAAATT